MKDSYGYSLDWWSYAIILFEMGKGSTQSLERNKDIPAQTARKIRLSRFHLPFGNYMRGHDHAIVPLLISVHFSNSCCLMITQQAFAEF